MILTIGGGSRTIARPTRRPFGALSKSLGANGKRFAARHRRGYHVAGCYFGENFRGQDSLLQLGVRQAVDDRVDRLFTPQRQKRMTPASRVGLKANGNENHQHNEGKMISLLIGILIIVVVGAICFWAIDKFATDGRLANLLKLLVVLVCLGAIIQRLMVLTY